jgi:hypothetical protein
MNLTWFDMNDMNDEYVVIRCLNVVYESYVQYVKCMWNLCDVWMMFSLILLYPMINDLMLCCCLQLMS